MYEKPKKAKKEKVEERLIWEGKMKEQRRKQLIQNEFKKMRQEA